MKIKKMNYHLYYDINKSELASKTRSLCGITTSMNFYLTIMVYATILTMHHYGREFFNEKKKKRRLSKNNEEDNISLKKFYLII